MHLQSTGHRHKIELVKTEVDVARDDFLLPLKSIETRYLHCFLFIICVLSLLLSHLVISILMIKIFIKRKSKYYELGFESLLPCISLIQNTPRRVLLSKKKKKDVCSFWFNSKTSLSSTEMRCYEIFYLYEISNWPSQVYQSISC